MKDQSLLNELELKIRDLVSTVDREREKNSNSSTKESQKLSEIEERVHDLKNLFKQLETN